jgi:hypothetical protein
MERGDDENKKIIITTTSTGSFDRKPGSFPDPDSCSKLNSTFGTQDTTDLISGQVGEWSAFCEHMGRNVRFVGTVCQFGGGCNFHK